MSILIDILAFIGAMSIFIVFWWAMIEAQTDIPGVNEPSSVFKLKPQPWERGSTPGMQVGKWLIMGLEDINGAVDIWIKHEDAIYEEYIGEWPMADTVEEVN